MHKPNLFLSTGIFPPAIGGPSLVVERLANELTKREYKCSVLTFGEKDSSERNYQVERVLFSNKAARSIKLYRKTFKLAKEADIIYAFDTYTNGFTAALAAKKLKKPLILRFTGDSAWEYAFNFGKTKDDILAFQKKPQRFVVKLKIKRRNFILKTANKIVTDCEFLKKVLKEIGIDEKKIKVINNAVEQVEENNSAPKEKSILTMARLVPWKGIDTLIELMPAIKKRVPKAKLVIAGDGPERKSLEKLAKETGADSIVFAGKVVDPVKKQKLFQNADIFALNTFYEGMSNSILEAMASGKAIITTNQGGNPELINGKNGILVDYNNAEQIESAIIELLSNSELSKKLSENARETSKKYTWDALLEKNIEVIKKILG